MEFGFDQNTLYAYIKFLNDEKIKMRLNKMCFSASF